MIFSIDHIALSPPNAAKAALALEKLGYSTVFGEKGKPNPASKRGFMSSFTQMHSVVFMRKEGSIPIEIVDHGRTNGRQGYVIALANGLQSDMKGPWKGESLGIRDGWREQCSVAQLGSRVFASIQGGGGFTITGAVLLTSSLKNSRAFWECFGMKIMERADTHIKMQFRSAISQAAFTFFLAEGGGEAALDDEGFNCIAFVSNSAEKERQMLVNKGYAASPVEEFMANGKALSIFFVRGPGGEAVEIIGTEKIANR